MIKEVIWVASNNNIEAKEDSAEIIHVLGNDYDTVPQTNFVEESIYTINSR